LWFIAVLISNPCATFLRGFSNLLFYNNYYFPSGFFLRFLGFWIAYRENKMANLSVFGEFGDETNGECEKIGGCYSDCLLRTYRYFRYPEALMSISYAACSIIFNRR